ncbi:38279_t:CDS:1, partial [Gigaspora margarita]
DIRKSGSAIKYQAAWNQIINISGLKPTIEIIKTILRKILQNYTIRKN